MRELIITCPSSLVALQLCWHLCQRVVYVRCVHFRQLTMGYLCYQEPTRVQYSVESSVRTCEEGSLNKISHCVVHKVNLRNLFKLLVTFQFHWVSLGRVLHVLNRLQLFGCHSPILPSCIQKSTFIDCVLGKGVDNLVSQVRSIYPPKGPQSLIKLVTLQ